MKIETFDRDDHQKLITAEIDSEAMEQFRHKAARKISSQTKIPGFRPGKAPFEVVRRMFGEKPIEEEALSIMLEEIYPDIIKEAGIQPYGPGKLEEIIQAEPPKFSFVVPLVPTVTLGDYRSTRVEYTPPIVTDEKVDEILRRLQRRSAVSTPVERAAVAGDIVYLTISSQLANPVEDEDAELIPESSRQMIAGDSRDFTDEEGNEWPFEGFSDRLIGVSAGQIIAFEHTFSDNGSDDDLNGKEAIFNITVGAVHELELHPLDDEFAQSLGSYETMETLRKNIHDDLLNDETNRYNNQYLEGLIAQMVQGAEVKYPPTAIEDETNHVVSHFVERLARDKMDLDTYLKTRDMTQEQFAEQEAKPIAENNLKRNLVLEQFALQEAIQISNEEVQLVFNMAHNQAQQDPSVKALAKGGMTKKQVGDNLARNTLNEIFNQRLMNRLRDIATGKADAPVETIAEESVVESPSGEVPASETPEIPSLETAVEVTTDEILADETPHEDTPAGTETN